MIISGGMSWVVPSLERKFSAIDFDSNKVRYLGIPHSHFDHWGAVPYLKGKFPHIQILASARSKELLSKEKVVSAAATANKELIKKLGLESECKKFHLQFDGIQVDQV